MARFKLFLLIPFWLLLLPLFIPFIAAKDTTIFINLYPRDYVDPRTAEGFICGIDKKIDPQHLISELNSQFILDFIDNTEDPSSDYKTSIFDVALLTKSGNVENMVDSLNCLFDKKEGLYSVFLAPPRAQCNSQSFKDAKEAGKDYYPVYISDNANFEEVIKKFESQADGLKTAFGGQYPKLCGTMTPMHDETAKARKDTLTILFNFAYDPDQTRSININEEQSCRQKNETENAFVKSEMFENSENVGFQDKDASVFEFVGVFETQVVRKVSTKAGIVFIKTKLGTADANDIVPYDDLLVFPKGKNMTKLFITIKIDIEQEEDEIFSIDLVSITETKTRLKRGAAQATQKTITVHIIGQPPIERLMDPEKLQTQVINNARLESQDSNSIKDFYLQIDIVHRLNSATLFLEIYEPGKSPAVDENNRMRAYYFPYKIGNPETIDDIGWVDIPYNPRADQPKFAFTGGMNGCAIVAMEKKEDDTMFRVFHLQSPKKRGGTRWNTYMEIIKKNNEVGNEIGSFAFEDYGIEDSGSMDFFAGTNFLYYGTDGNWWYVSQFIEYEGAMDRKHHSVAHLQDWGPHLQQKCLLMKENMLHNGIVRKFTADKVFSGRAPGKNEE